MLKQMLVAVALLAGPLALAEQSKMVALPSGAKLIGTTQASEIREFPEMKSMKKKNNIMAKEMVAVSAVDNVYQSDKPYEETVRFFDLQFNKMSPEMVDRSMTKTATAWAVKMPSGDVANVMVRNTQPPTIETIQAAAAMGETYMNK